jgi:glycine cleavage system regulatory protein
MASKEKDKPVFGLLQIAGPNQTGMVAQTSAFLQKCGANIVTCHAVRFGTQLFTATIIFSVPADSYRLIEEGLSAIKAYEPRLLKTRELSTEQRDPALMYELTVYAYDKAGLVAEVAGLMSAEQLDVVQLSCVTYPAPFDGQSLFMIEMTLEAPDHMAAKRARTKLDALAPSHGWDVYWKPLSNTGMTINPLAAFPPSKMGAEIKMPAD